MFLRLSQARPEPNTSESGRHNHIRETFSRGSRHKRSRGKRPTPMFLTICATNHVGGGVSEPQRPRVPNSRGRSSNHLCIIHRPHWGRWTSTGTPSGLRPSWTLAAPTPPVPIASNPKTRRSRQQPVSGSDHSQHTAPTPYASRRRQEMRQAQPYGPMWIIAEPNVPRTLTRGQCFHPLRQHTDRRAFPLQPTLDHQQGRLV